jgi:hypothetical protein
MVILCPLGYHCNITNIMIRLRLKKETSLFEWFQIGSFQYVTDVILSIYNKIDDNIIKYYSGEMKLLHDQLYSYHYHNIEEFKVIFKRRAERFLNMLKQEEVLFLTMNPKGVKIPECELRTFHDCIQKINPYLKWKILIIDTDNSHEYYLPYVISKSIPWSYYEEQIPTSLDNLFKEHVDFSLEHFYTPIYIQINFLSGLGDFYSYICETYYFSKKLKELNYKIILYVHSPFKIDLNIFDKNTYQYYDEIRLGTQSIHHKLDNYKIIYKKNNKIGAEWWDAFGPENMPTILPTEFFSYGRYNKINYKNCKDIPKFSSCYIDKTHSYINGKLTNFSIIHFRELDDLNVMDDYVLDCRTMKKLKEIFLNRQILLLSNNNQVKKIIKLNFNCVTFDTIPRNYNNQDCWEQTIVEFILCSFAENIYLFTKYSWVSNFLNYGLIHHKNGPIYPYEKSDSFINYGSFNCIPYETNRDLNIQIFVVFHKHIFDECYDNIPDDILYKYFTFLSVNEKIPKHYTKNKYKIINEWELPIYDSKFQTRGYNENSSIYHVFMNNLHKPYQYIGFFQYDMVFKDNIVQFLQFKLNIPTCFYYELYNFKFCSYQTWNEPPTLDYIIKDYEKFYNKSFTKTCHYPLFNSFIIPIETFEKVMNWVIQLYDKLYPWCINPPYATHFGHIGGIYERVMAYAIGEESLRSIKLNISHDHYYKKLSY